MQFLIVLLSGKNMFGFINLCLRGVVPDSWDFGIIWGWARQGNGLCFAYCGLVCFILWILLILYK